MKFILKVLVFLFATFAPVYSVAGLHWESEAQWEEMEEEMEEESGEEMEGEKYDEDSEDLFESIQKFLFYVFLFFGALLVTGFIVSSIIEWFNNKF